MKRFVSRGLLLACVLMVPVLSFAADAPHIGEGGIPLFEFDKTFPKLPAAWTAGGSVSAVAIDEQTGHVWYLTRPRALAKGTSKAATPPPVLEFDAAGNYIRGWGGQSGPGYNWPSNEHGMSIDSKGFVWIAGNFDTTTTNPDNASTEKLPSDSQILKFTKDGKFVMAIGKPGLVGSNKTDVPRGATNTYYNEKTNELWVADGYGNSRVIVYDADSGKMKRMWGAYGKPPLDMADRPARKPPAADPWVAVSEVLQQFQSPIHDVKIANDGLVYLADRGNKRVQVFTQEGKFVAEQFVGLDSRFPLQARAAAFSPDQRFLYLGGSPETWILNRRTLEVLGSIPLGNGISGERIGHTINVDKAGNLYLVQATTTGLDGKTPNSFGAVRLNFKGYSPTTTPGQTEGVHGK